MALQHLKKKIGRISAGNESELKKTFESEEILAKNLNPSKYVDVLLDIKDELYDKCKYVKTERDIADQLIKVLPKEFEHTRNKLRDLRRDRALIDLSKIQEELQEIYDNLNDKRKKNKKNI